MVHGLCTIHGIFHISIGLPLLSLSFLLVFLRSRCIVIAPRSRLTVFEDVKKIIHDVRAL